jgi:hypothetical protein
VFYNACKEGNGQRLCMRACMHAYMPSDQTSWRRNERKENAPVQCRCVCRTWQMEWHTACGTQRRPSRCRGMLFQKAGTDPLPARYPPAPATHFLLHHTVYTISILGHRIQLSPEAEIRHLLQHLMDSQASPFPTAIRFGGLISARGRAPATHTVPLTLTLHGALGRRTLARRKM